MPDRSRAWIPIFGAVFAASLAATAAAAPFSLVLLPDTQHYSDSATNILHFNAQMQWILNNQVAENIVFTTLVGDVVQNGGGGGGNAVEWGRAVDALDNLHFDATDPPYSTVAGNHDYDVVSTKPSASAYIANVGPARYAAKTWFVGFAPDLVNMSQTFAADGNPYLHIGLEWLPSDAAIEFAQGTIAANPTLPVILSTHQHLGTGNPASRQTAGATPTTTGNNDAESVYRKLIEPFPQVFLMLAGHVHGNGRIASTTALGRPVNEVMTDYQNDPNGGNGWFQLVEFRPDADEIEFDTLSPTYVAGVTAGPDRNADPNGNFTLSYDLDALHEYLSTRVVLHYRQGQDNGFGTYSSAIDTHVGDGDGGVTLPGVSYGSADNIRVEDEQDNEQGLLRFDDIVGAGAGQIPPGTVIQKAILTLTTEGANADGDGASLHRMLVPWDANSTWNSLVGGVQIGAEAEATADASTGFVPVGTRSFDVTASVQAWVDGAANHGWVLQSGGVNRWEFRSSDWAGLVERPMLTVDHLAAPVPPSPEPLLQTGHFATGFSSGVPLTIPSIDPAGVTYHAPSGHLFVSDSEIDEVAAAFAVVGANLFEISVDGSALYQQWDLNAIGNGEPTGITFNEFDDHFYVSNDDTGGVHRYAFDGTTFTEVDSFPMPSPPGGGTPDPEGISSDPATGRMWVVDGTGRSIVTFTYAAGTETIESNIDLAATIPNAAERPQDPEGIAFAPSTGTLFLVSTPEQAIYQLTTAGAFVAKHELSGFTPGTVAPQGLGLVPAAPSLRPTVRLALVDGGIDNDADPNERDGNVYLADIMTFVCDDGVDNDGDGFVDFQSSGGDPGCRSIASTLENPECQDGINNDGDGLIDFDGGASLNGGVPLTDPDPECVSKPYRNSEKPNSSCGLGAELALLLSALGVLRAREVRRTP